MPRSLPDAKKGDRYRVLGGVPLERRYEAVIARCDGRLVAVVDYNVIGPVECLPAPWCDLHWEKIT